MGMGRSVKVYRGRQLSKIGGKSITVQEGTMPPRPLAHAVKHSANTMGWGSSTGPSTDLARSILIDLFGPLGRSKDLYEAFRISFIEKLPSDESWIIDEQEIVTWASFGNMGQEFFDTAVELQYKGLLTEEPLKFRISEA